LTPEGKVKAAVRKVLDLYKSELDTFWPVPAGYGPSHLDCIICAWGKFVSIETKAPGKKPTPRQKERIASVKRAGGIAVVIDGTHNTTTVTELQKLLEDLRNAARSNFPQAQADRRLLRG
jgi:hypothetical protein